jgi:hypothetical protein
MRTLIYVETKQSPSPYQTFSEKKEAEYKEFCKQYAEKNGMKFEESWGETMEDDLKKGQFVSYSGYTSKSLCLDEKFRKTKNYTI